MILKKKNTKIYLIKSKGRFGNQLFQLLHVISDYSANSIILAFNFSETKEIISNNISNIFFINSTNFIDRIIDLLFKILIKYKIFSVIEQNTIETNFGLIHTSDEKFLPGFFKRFIVVSGFFQSAKFLSNLNKDFYKNSNMKFLNSSEYIFVHFRKSDYREIFLLDRSIILDSSYYVNSINYFTNLNSHVKFLLFSDESISISDLNLFNGYDYKISSLNNPLEIYEEMLSCSGGIISNSSLSWLAGFHLKKINDSSIVVAPFNHIGCNVNIEIPEGINYHEFIYLK